ALVEEALGDDEVATGQRTERGARRGEIRDRLLRGAHRHRALDGKPGGDRIEVDAIGEPAIDLGAQLADLVGKLARARRRLAEPERDRRWLAARIFDEHAPGFDTPDAPRRVAELEDVAGRAFDREVFVDRADRRFFGPLDDRVVVVVGNRAARRDRR